MTIRFRNELLVINSFSLALILLISILPNIVILRIILGIPFLLFLPGYVLLGALLPYREQFEVAERFSLAIGLSIAISTIIGIVVNHAWEIDLFPIVISLASFTAVMTCITWYRRRKREGKKSPEIAFTISFPRPPTSAKERLLSIILLISILAAITAMMYAVVSSRPREQFTEFYVMGGDGSFETYPTELAEGEYGEVNLHVINHEGQNMRYQIKVFVDNNLTTEIGPIDLGNKQEWQGTATFTPSRTHAMTRLTAAIDNTDDMDSSANNIIRVESATSFASSDCIKIGRATSTKNEVARIERIEENTIFLEEPLEQPHTEGEYVNRVQNVQFVLSKVLTFTDDSIDHTLLSVYLHNHLLNFSITNVAESTVHYQIEVEVRTGVDTEPRLIHTSMILNAYEKKHWQVDCTPMEDWTYNTVITVLRDEDMLYQGRLYDYFQILYLWMTVTDENA